MTDDAPKSAYDIALEKLKRQDRERGEQAVAPLTSEQKERIAEIRRRHEARLAELEILFRSERGKALASGEPEAIEKVEKEYAQERERVAAQREREVAAARTAAKDDGRDPPAGRKRRGKKMIVPVILFVLVLSPAGGSRRVPASDQAASGVAGPESGAAAPQAARVVVLKAARLLDGSEAAAKRDVLVVIEGERIRSVGPAAGATLPGGAEVIDLGDSTLLPGLIDAHTHLLLQGDATSREYDDQLLKESVAHRTVRAVAAARTALEHGFTTIRDLGTEGAGYADVSIRDAIAEGVIPGPRVLVATRALDISGAYPLRGFALDSPVPTGVQVVDGPDAGRRAVREQVKHGADWIKVYCDRSYFVDEAGRLDSIPTFEADELKAIVDEAHRQGRRVAAHAIGPKGVARALDAGVDSVEHGCGLEPDAIRRMVARGIYYCPTLTVMQGATRDPDDPANDIWVRMPEFLKRSFEAATKAGVKIAFGTDAGGFPWTRNEAEEFEWMVKYGMSPERSIRSATAVAAAMLGREGDLGRVAPGYLADLVAVPGDPLSDIGLMRRVGFVMTSGRVFRNDLRRGV